MTHEHKPTTIFDSLPRRHPARRVPPDVRQHMSLERQLPNHHVLMEEVNTSPELHDMKAVLLLRTSEQRRSIPSLLAGAVFEVIASQYGRHVFPGLCPPKETAEYCSKSIASRLNTHSEVEWYFPGTYSTTHDMGAPDGIVVSGKSSVFVCCEYTCRKPENLPRSFKDGFARWKGYKHLLKNEFGSSHLVFFTPDYRERAVTIPPHISAIPVPVTPHTLGIYVEQLINMDDISLRLTDRRSELDRP